MQDIETLYQQHADDPRPLPLIVAQLWGFPLQYYAQEGGELYAVQDWIRGLTGEINAKKVSKQWSDMQSSVSIGTLKLHPLPYFASDGKTYQRDFTDAHGLYIIAAHLRATKARPALLEIKRYLAAAGVLVDDARRDPERAAHALEQQSDYKRLISAGFSPAEARQWIAQRDEGKRQRRGIVAIWAERGARGRQYADLTNQVTQVAIGATATKRRAELQVTSGSLRDHLSAAENAAIGATEYFAAALHIERDSRGYDELREDVGDTRPIIDAARQEIERAFSKRRPRRRQAGGVPGG